MRRQEKKIPQKKANQLPLASMSLNYNGGIMRKSGKHRSQEVQKWRRLGRKRAKSSSSNKYKNS